TANCQDCSISTCVPCDPHITPTSISHNRRHKISGYHEMRTSQSSLQRANCSDRLCALCGRPSHVRDVAFRNPVDGNTKDEMAGDVRFSMPVDRAMAGCGIGFIDRCVDMFAE